MVSQRARLPDFSVEPREKTRPISSRLNPADHHAISAARAMRSEAASFRHSIERANKIFESEFDKFRSIVERAPAALQESIDQLHRLAGVGSHYFSEVQRFGLERRRDHMCHVLDAIVDTANERLLDVEGDHVRKSTANPYSLDSARDIQKDLTQIIEFLATTNSLAQIPELDDAWRLHLIALCKTAIVLLEAPIVELGLMEQCASSLKRLFKYLAPIVVSGAISGVVGAAAEGLMRPLMDSNGPALGKKAA